MQTNVLDFTAQHSANPGLPPASCDDNVVSLDEWKQQPRLCRTHYGVYFRTETLCEPGDAA